MLDSSDSRATGARVGIRGEVRLVRIVEPSAVGGMRLPCDSVAELVRSKSSMFLAALEGNIEMLDPGTTKLVADGFSNYSATLLHDQESQRYRRVANDDCIHLAVGDYFQLGNIEGFLSLDLLCEFA